MSIIMIHQQRFLFRITTSIFLLLLICYCCCYCCHGLQFRSATTNDISQARQILLQQAMNPLGISKDTMLVAYNNNNNIEEENIMEENEPSLVGFGQIRPLNDQYSELASLYVRPEYRHQGIGTELVSELLKRHDTNNNNSVMVCLLTLKSTIPFYEPFGFHVVSTDKELQTLPTSIQLEYKAGQIISTFLGNDLVCMIQQQKE